MSESTEARDDLVLLRDALIVLGGYLPLFNPARAARAERAYALREEAFAAVDRFAERAGLPPPPRIISRHRMVG